MGKLENKKFQFLTDSVIFTIRFGFLVVGLESVVKGSPNIPCFLHQKTQLRIHHCL